MALGFKRAHKRGQYYELTLEAIKVANAIDFDVKGRDERDYEHILASQLHQSKTLQPNLITQVNRDQINTITPVDFFGYRHRPDIAIGQDCTAIEVKVMHNSQSLRDMLGQGICYRMQYRFVILVFVLPKMSNELITSCENEIDSNGEPNNEHNLLRTMADDLNIFSVIGPAGKRKNLVFS